MKKPLHSPRTQVTIGQGMAAIVLLAALLSLPHLQTVNELRVAALVVLLLPLILLVKRMLDALFGIPCPACTRWTLRRLARARAYYRCSSCGERFKRFGLGPWQDASGLDDDAIYRGKASARRWVGFVSPENPGDTTTGALLRDQRRRREAHVPNTVGTTFLHWKTRIGVWFGLTLPPPSVGTTTTALLQNQRQRAGRVPKATDESIPQTKRDAAS